MKPSGLADSPLFIKADDQSIPKPNESKAEPNTQESLQAPMPPRNHDTNIEMVRKAVKMIGKEAATYRFTRNEKQALLEILYAYRLRNIKISENEIARIAINYLINDHKSNLAKSILNEVLEALNQ